MDHSLSDMQMAELRCIQVAKGGIKYELMLSLQSSESSSSFSSSYPKTISSTSELGKRKHHLESKSSESNMEASKHRNLGSGDMKGMRPKSAGCINSWKRNSENVDRKLTLREAEELEKWLENVMDKLQSMEKQLKIQDSLINEMQNIAENLGAAFKNMVKSQTNFQNRNKPLVDI
ncbi:hypothetical protein HNY73_021039 [Argiope bruennichi]|uniref:Uncharacterized protein n=1 Tax=Argiope bruennichi TaxID=94029 RepID=A0A8T0E8W2_ARGBR|nr:hypothetical protein HNY73_021039 [Argiope bruennichi]